MRATSCIAPALRQASRGFGFSDAKSSPDNATAVVRARLAAGASLAQSCHPSWVRVRRPDPQTSVGSLLCSRQLLKRIQTCPGARLTTTPCLPIIGWHVTPRDTAEASVRVRRVGSVTDPMRSCGTLGRLNAIKHLTRHGLDAVCRHWRSSLTALEPERTKSRSMQPQRAPARGAGCLGPLFLAAIRPSATVGVRP